MASLAHTTPSGVPATGLPAAPPRLAELICRERLRTRIEAAVARLIDALDQLDGDADLEDGCDAEAVNEDGGDILDELHDEDGSEPNDTGIYASSGWGVRAHA